MLTTSNQDPSPTVRVVCGDGGGGVKTLSKSDAVSLKSSVVVSSKKTTTTTPRRPLAVINGNQAANTPVVSYIEIMLFFFCFFIRKSVIKISTFLINYQNEKKKNYFRPLRIFLLF